MRQLFILLIFLAGLSLTSCNSNRQLTRRQTELLSQQFGFPIHKKDDLRLYNEAARWLGVPYRSGGNTLKGVDCSGLVVQIYKQTYHKQLERTTSRIAKENCRKIGKGKLKTGDLVFFNTAKKKRKEVNHVGIFLKNGYFIHASTSKGVMVNNLREKYYHKAWRQGGRVK